MGILMRSKSWQVLAAVCLCAFASFFESGGAYAQATAAPIKIASLVEDGIAVSPGDLLRTTRIFPNWNLNCEVLLSQGRHLCAVELRSTDANGRQVFAWSIALGSDGNPIIIFKVPADISQSYGLRMVIGSLTTILTPRKEDCNGSECRIVAPFEAGLRTLMMSQQKIHFSLSRDNVVLQIEAPLAGLSEALDMARRDPIGLVAAQHGGSPASPVMAAVKGQSARTRRSNPPPKVSADLFDQLKPSMAAN
jgi:hypothetical protein